MTREVKFFCDWCKEKIPVQVCPEIVLHKTTTDRHMQRYQTGFILCEKCKKEILTRLGDPE